MRRDDEQLKANYFDILVIGGGINGCAIARDAALRGAKVALIEKDDFASGASGKTTKLIHGGIRYLEQFNFKLVYEALHERAILLRTAPHSVRPFEFIIPVYKHDQRSLLKIKTGVFVYDRLAGSNNIRCHRTLKKNEVMSLEQNIDSHSLKGAVLYYDAQMDDGRLCLDNAISAYNAGGCVANKVEAVGFIKDKRRIIGAEALDKLTHSATPMLSSGSPSVSTLRMPNTALRQAQGPSPKDPEQRRGKNKPRCLFTLSAQHEVPSGYSEGLTGEEFFIRANIVVNATGAWSNRTVKMDEPDALAITRPTKGIHIVYRKLPHERAILLSAQKDKRILFIIPWRGLTLIGTTDTDYTGSADDVYACADEVEYLLEEARRVFPGQNLEREGIITTFAGLRPLVNIQDKPTWQVSREHLIRESRAGLISVVGGKYTTYRHLAEQVVDLAFSKLEGRNFKKCITQIVGPSLSTSDADRTDLHKLIEHAVKEEMANTLIDLLVRRLELSTTSSLGLEHLKDCADIMAGFLGWTDTQKEHEIRMYKEEVRKNRNF